MNAYYNFTDPAVAFSIVDGLRYNREMTKITTAFDNFPPAVEFISGAYNYGEQVGTSTTDYEVTVSAIPSGAQYISGNNVAGRIAFANTGPVTLSVSDGGPKPVFMNSVGAAVADDLRAGGVYTFVYDGTKWVTLETSVRYFNLAEQSVDQAEASRDDAAASAAAASSFETTASAAASTAAASTGPAASSATAAASSATVAAAAASSASGSSTSAQGSANTAGQRASAATQSASAAATSAANAAASASAAATSAANAAASASAAATSAADASQAEQDAEDILTDAGLDARLAETIRDIEMMVGCVELFAANLNPNTTYPGTTWLRLPAGVSLAVAAVTGADVMSEVGSDSVTLSANTMPAHSHEVPTTSTTASAPSISFNSHNYPATNMGSFIDGTRYSSVINAQSRGTSGFTPTATISTAGDHTHQYDFALAGGSPGQSSRIRGQYPGTTGGIRSTRSAGAHTHTITAPVHSHAFSIGAHSHTAVLPNHTHTLTPGPHSHTVAVGSHTHTASFSATSTGSGTAFSVINSNLKLVAWYRTA